MKKQLQMDEAIQSEASLSSQFEKLEMNRLRTLEAGARAKRVITDHRIREQSYGDTVPWEVRGEWG